MAAEGQPTEPHQALGESEEFRSLQERISRAAKTDRPLSAPDEDDGGDDECGRHEREQEEAQARQGSRGIVRPSSAVKLREESGLRQVL